MNSSFQLSPIRKIKGLLEATHSRDWRRQYRHLHLQATEKLVKEIVIGLVATGELNLSVLYSALRSIPPKPHYGDVTYWVNDVSDVKLRNVIVL